MRCNHSAVLEFVAAALLALVWIGCEGPQGPAGRDATAPDTQAPVVDWFYPLGGDVLDSVQIIEVNAIDNTSVDSVHFIVNGRTAVNGLANITTVGTHYRARWDTRMVTPGQYTILARAFDHAGNVGLSTPINVLVYNILSGQYALQNFADFPDVVGWNLPDVDHTSIYAVQLTPMQACSLYAVRFQWRQARPGITHTDSLKYYLFAADSITGYPGVALDSLVFPSDSVPNQLRTVIVPGRLWAAGTTRYIGISCANPASSDTIQLTTDVYPYLQKDWYYVPNTGWSRIPGVPDPHNLMIGAMVNYNRE